MRDLIEWIDRAAPPSLMVVSGGSEADFFEAALQPTAVPRRVLCDRTYAARVAERASDLGVPPPQTVISKGLGRDLGALMNATRPTATLVPAGLVDAYVAERTALAEAEVEMLCSYRVPAPVLARAIQANLAGELGRIASNGRCPVAVHDPRDSLRGAGIKRAATATMRGAPEPAPEALTAEAEAPGIEAVLRHARFLSDTSLDDLLRLHGTYGPREQAPLREYWVRALVDAAGQGADADDVADAILVLTRLAVAQAIRPRG